MTANPSAVLFCCDHNSVRSPMAEGIMKKYYGTRIHVQSAGVRSELEVDGFSVAVCAEIGVALEKHRVRSFEEMEAWGDRIDAYELIVALSPAAMRQAQEYTRYHALDRILDGLPMVIVEDGRVLKARLNKSLIDEGDVLSAARRLRGLERMDQIKYAVLEANGEISIIPKER